jgi:hypothetical protein
MVPRPNLLYTPPFTPIQEVPMIRPYGSDTLDPRIVEGASAREALQEEAKGLRQVTVSSAAAANCVMLGAGYFNPLTGMMSLADSLSVAEKWKTTGGLMWPVPILNRLASVSRISVGDRIALRDPNREGEPVLAIQEVTAIDEATPAQLEAMTKAVFGTTDEKHPGVETFASEGPFFVAGPVQVLDYSYFDQDFPETFRTAPQIRAEIAERGWEKVVAFQTRNPMHRAHEELCKMALEAVAADGVLIHMLLGKLKPGDIPTARARRRGPAADRGAPALRRGARRALRLRRAREEPGLPAHVPRDARVGLERGGARDDAGRDRDVPLRARVRAGAAGRRRRDPLVDGPLRPARDRAPPRGRGRVRERRRPARALRAPLA